MMTSFKPDSPEADVPAVLQAPVILDIEEFAPLAGDPHLADVVSVWEPTPPLLFGYLIFPGRERTPA